MEQVGFEKLNQWKYSCNKVCSNQRSENAAKIEVSGRLSALLFCTAFQLIYSCDFFFAPFCQRGDRRQGNCCFSLWQGDAALSQDAETHCSYSDLLNLCGVSRCWGIDRPQWWTGGVSRAANQKVNSLSVEKGKRPPGLWLAHLFGWCAATAFDCVFMQIEGPLSRSLIELLSVPSNKLFGEPSLILEYTSNWVRWKDAENNRVFPPQLPGLQHRVSLLFFHPFICAFLTESLRQSLSVANWKVILL